MKIMKFNFRNLENREQRKLFVPINSFSFAAFPVRIRFPQPPSVAVSIFDSLTRSASTDYSIDRADRRNSHSRNPPVHSSS